jgi:hypothetical protein
VTSICDLIPESRDAPAGALHPDYEEVPFSDGATCNFTGEDALYGTPGYPEEESQTVLLRWRESEDGQGSVCVWASWVLDGVQYDLLDGDGPASLLVYGTMTANNAGGGVFLCQWTLTDLDGNSLGRTGGILLGDWPWTVHNWHGPCSVP